jgi:hypothetical protein
MLTIDYEKLKAELKHHAANPFKKNSSAKEWMAWIKKYPNRGRPDTYMTRLCCLRASLGGKRHITTMRDETRYKLSAAQGLISLPVEENQMPFWEVTQEGNDIIGTDILELFLKKVDECEKPSSS